jgi:hypothetical protein
MYRFSAGLYYISASNTDMKRYLFLLFLYAAVASCAGPKKSDPNKEKQALIDALKTAPGVDPADGEKMASKVEALLADSILNAIQIAFDAVVIKRNNLELDAATENQQAARLASIDSLTVIINKRMDKGILTDADKQEVRLLIVNLGKKVGELERVVGEIEK